MPGTLIREPLDVLNPDRNASPVVCVSQLLRMFGAEDTVNRAEVHRLLNREPGELDFDESYQLLVNAGFTQHRFDDFDMDRGLSDQTYWIQSLAEFDPRVNPSDDHREVYELWRQSASRVLAMRQFMGDSFVNEGRKATVTDVTRFINDGYVIELDSIDAGDQPGFTIPGLIYGISEGRYLVYHPLFGNLSLMGRFIGITGRKFAMSAWKRP